jgi:alanyl-tRNA synthetase
MLKNFWMKIMISENEWLDLKKKEKILRESARILSVYEKDIVKVVKRFLIEKKKKEEDIERLRNLNL